MDLPGIRELVELPLLSSVLAGFLPQLVLRLFFSLMPYILAALERLEGLPAESEVEFGVVRKYYAFQVRPAQLPGSPAPQEVAGRLADASPSGLPAAPEGPGLRKSQRFKWMLQLCVLPECPPVLTSDHYNSVSRPITIGIRHSAQARLC